MYRMSLDPQCHWRKEDDLNDLRSVCDAIGDMIGDQSASYRRHMETFVLHAEDKCFHMSATCRRAITDHVADRYDHMETRLKGRHRFPFFPYFLRSEVAGCSLPRQQVRIDSNDFNRLSAYQPEVDQVKSLWYLFTTLLVDEIFSLWNDQPVSANYKGVGFELIPRMLFKESWSPLRY